VEHNFAELNRSRSKPFAITPEGRAAHRATTLYVRYKQQLNFYVQKGVSLFGDDEQAWRGKYGKKAKAMKDAELTLLVSLRKALEAAGGNSKAADDDMTRKLTAKEKKELKALLKGNDDTSGYMERHFRAKLPFNPRLKKNRRKK